MPVSGIQTIDQIHEQPVTACFKDDWARMIRWGPTGGIQTCHQVHLLAEDG